MFYKDKIEMLERRLNFLIQDLEDKQVLSRTAIGISGSGHAIPAIYLEDLQKTQQRILDYLELELETTPQKTKLVKKEKQ